MKFSIIKSFPINKAAKLFTVLCLTLLSFSLNAQYCASYATSPADEFIANVKIEDGTKVLLNNNSYVPSSTANTGCGDYTDYTGMTAIPMAAGGVYKISITSGYCGTGVYTNQALAWIDYNRNNAFEASEAVRSTPLAGASGVRDIVYTFTVPCNITPGKTRLRCVISETSTMTNPGSACGTYTWGETEDYTIDLQLPTSLSANFAAPSSAWIKSIVNFVNVNPTGYISHTWDANNDGTIEAANSINFSYTWTTAGTKCVKLKSVNCLGSDSVVKCLTVSAPTVVPDASFVADRVYVEQYDVAKLFDLSAYGPYQWAWEVYDSTDVNDVKDINSGDVVPNPNSNGSGATSKNPEFMFMRPGCYTVVLTSKNDIGFSKPKVKKCYITVTLPTDYFLGLGTYGPNLDNVVESSTGIIMDNGGDKLPYGNSQGYGTRSYLQITPCNATKIELTMSQLKFNGTGDVLRVWDGKTAGGPGSTLLASWTSNLTTPKKVVATSGSMFILFESDASGVDSGFIGTYTSTLGPATVASPSFSPSSTPAYNSAPVKFTNTTQGVVGVPTWEWTIDGSVASTKKNLNTVFYSDGAYDVCLEIKSCVGKSKSCNTINVISPASAAPLDFDASNRRPKMTVDAVTLIPNSVTSDRFEWTIYPTNYTLVNPPSSPSAYGSGYVRYSATPGDSVPTPILKFNSAGCYTIALKTWNSLDPSKTTSTIVKNKFICALNYCIPSAFIAAADLGLNSVVLKDNGTSIMDNTSVSGIRTYTDFTKLKSADLTFGKKYTLEVGRTSNVDSANRKAWIDWNIDGDFDDNGEEIFFETSTLNKTYSKTFTVPDLANAFEGTTRLRVAINFNKDNTTPCGPLTAGEYHDYAINLYNDNIKPVITLKGNATERIEIGTAYVDSSATAYDASEGPITYKMVTFNDLDVNTTGVYTYEYNVTDASGNKAEPVTRTVIVVNDKTKPVITLNPASPGCIEADRNNDPYSDPGATAYNTNPYYSLTTAIRTSGVIDTRQVGNYTLVYTVKDFAGNEATASRNICVADTKAPIIKGTGATNIQIGTLWIDQTYAEDAYDDAPFLLKSWYPEALNPSVKGTYTLTYIAKDHTGNTSAPVVVEYKVDDFIAPVINLNTFDVVEHPVNTPYKSVTATVTDNFYGVGEVSIAKIGSNVDPNVLGTYTETFKAVDGSNNVTIKIRTVKVIDNVAPVLWGGTIYGCVGENIWPMWNLTTTDNYYGPQTLLPLVEVVAQNVNPKEEGVYYITYKVQDPSGNTSVPLTRQVVYTYWPKCFNSTLAVNTVGAEENAVSVSPNPTTGVVKLSFNNHVVRNPEVKVFNSMGQLVMEKTFETSASSVNLDLSDYAKGIYSISINAEGTLITKKIIVQ